MVADALNQISGMRVSHIQVAEIRKAASARSSRRASATFTTATNCRTACCPSYCPMRRARKSASNCATNPARRSADQHRSRIADRDRSRRLNLSRRHRSEPQGAFAQGLDDIGLVMQNNDEIEAFEQS